MFPGTIGGLLVLVGAIWIIQGFSLAPTGSFMDGNPFWGWVGLACCVSGILMIIVRRLRTGRNRQP